MRGAAAGCFPTCITFLTFALASSLAGQGVGEEAASEKGMCVSVKVCAYALAFACMRLGWFVCAGAHVPASQHLSGALVRAFLSCVCMRSCSKSAPLPHCPRLCVGAHVLCKAGTLLDFTCVLARLRARLMCFSGGGACSGPRGQGNLQDLPGRVVTCLHGAAHLRDCAGAV